MSEFLSPITELETPFDMVVLIILICTISSIVTAIVNQVGAFAQQRQDLAFKRELIDGGMSADEVQRVVEARSQPSQPTVDDDESEIEAKVHLAAGAKP